MGRLSNATCAGLLLASIAMADEPLPDAEMLLFLAEFADDSGEVLDADALIEVMTPVHRVEEQELDVAAAASADVAADEENDDVDL